MIRFGTVLTVALAFALVGCDTGLDSQSESVSDVSKGGGEDEQNNQGTTVKVRVRSPEPGDGNIGGQLTMIDDGDRVRVTGAAQGFDPNENYIALFQGVGSKVSGPDACEPVGVSTNPGDPNGALRSEQRRVGGWKVEALGRGEIRALVWTELFKGAGAGEGYSGTYQLRDRPPELGDDSPRNGLPDYVPLDKVGTISIRVLSETDALGRAGFGPEAVVACGRVAV